MNALQISDWLADSVPTCAEIQARLHVSPEVARRLDRARIESFDVGRMMIERGPLFVRVERILSEVRR